MTAQGGHGLLHLRAAGTSLLVDAAGEGLPRILHWGADLGAGADGLDPSVLVPAVANSSVDVAVRLALLPERAAGWPGRPGLTGSRGGGDFSPAFSVTSLEVTATTLRLRAADTGRGLSLTSELVLEEQGVLRVRHALRNDGDGPYALGELLTVLPVPAHGTEVLDLAGRWCKERVPQRLPLHHGAWVREGRHGRTGHDAPLVTALGTPGFGWRHGEVWAMHLAWSGDRTTYAERVPDGRAVLGAGELLGPGEVVLGPGETYEVPEVLAVHSTRGLDGVSDALHAFVRARARHPRRPRPVTLNTWEAVYFDHDLDRLRALADAAAELGIERYVLDDGWFRHRRDDTAGLGDWYVDERVWPHGLTPLVDHVHARGMEFGLWVEPEMVNPDSDLFRAHPDWVLRADQDARLPVPWRRQQVLDVANAGAYAYLLERLDALLSEDDITYLKWDQNRDLVEAGAAGRPGVHAHTLAVYRLLDELRARHPGVEIESCASGGARVDLGILARTDRVWASDTNDALERQAIQRWTGLLLPPELVGAHVGPPTAHTTGRTHGLAFRAATALFGHMGVEWDVASASAEDREGLARAIAVHKRHRDLLHTGTVVRGDHPDPAAWVHGVVGADRAEALFAYVQLTSSVAERPAPVRLPGLDPARTYRVEVLDVAGPVGVVQLSAPPWVATDATASGQVLGALGLPVPVLSPEQALVLLATAL